jgi:hypothetical protein
LTSLASRFQKLFGLETKGALATPEPWFFELFGSAPASSGIPRMLSRLIPLRALPTMTTSHIPNTSLTFGP